MTRPPIPRKLLGNAKAMRAEMTRSELKLWNQLRAHRLMGLSFRRQVPVGNYIVDFACPAHRPAIEVDGPSHSFDDAITRDKTRTGYLNDEGWQVLRFSNEEVIQNIDECCRRILAVLTEKGVAFL